LERHRSASRGAAAARNGIEIRGHGLRYRM
jgi:hypothetical protein